MMKLPPSIAGLFKRKSAAEKLAEKQAAKPEPERAQEAADRFPAAGDGFQDPGSQGSGPVAFGAANRHFVQPVCRTDWLPLGDSALFGWSVQLEELEAKKQQEAKLKEDWLGKKKQAVNLDEYRRQLAEIDRSFGALLKQLPNKAEMGDMLVDINKAAQAGDCGRVVQAGR
jgi:hypothetical protein